MFFRHVLSFSHAVPFTSSDRLVPRCLTCMRTHFCLSTRTASRLLLARHPGCLLSIHFADLDERTARLLPIHFCLCTCPLFPLLLTLRLVMFNGSSLLFFSCPTQLTCLLQTMVAAPHLCTVAFPAVFLTRPRPSVLGPRHLSQNLYRFSP